MAFCYECKAAGNLLTPPPAGMDDNRGQPNIREMARDLHSKCKGPSHCDCLHRVPLSEEEKQQNEVIRANNLSKM